MSSIPIFNGRAQPDSTDCEFRLGGRKVRVCPDQLIDALAGDAEYFGDLGHAHQVDRHKLSIRKLLPSCKTT